MIDVVSEQRCVVVAIADAFIVVSGHKCSPNSCISIPCNGLYFSEKGQCSINTYM